MKALDLIRELRRIRADEFDQCLLDRDYGSATKLEAEVKLLDYLEEKILEDE